MCGLDFSLVFFVFKISPKISVYSVWVFFTEVHASWLVVLTSPVNVFLIEFVPPFSSMVSVVDHSWWKKETRGRSKGIFLWRKVSVYVKSKEEDWMSSEKNCKLIKWMILPTEMPPCFSFMLSLSSTPPNLFRIKTEALSETTSLIQQNSRWCWIHVSREIPCVYNISSQRDQKRMNFASVMSASLILVLWFLL